MNFLRTIMWVILAVGVAIFATANWHDVMLDLWGDLRMAIKLPVLLALTFALGFLPTLFYYRAKVWRLHRQLALAERNAKMAPQTPPPPPSPVAVPKPKETESPF